MRRILRLLLCLEIFSEYVLCVRFGLDVGDIVTRSISILFFGGEGEGRR